MNPNQIPTADVLFAIEADLERAFALYGAGDAAGAAARCQRVLDVMPGHVTALHLAGVITLNRGDAGTAVDLLARAAAGDPADASIHFNHAVALAASRRRADAVGAYEKCLSCDPDNADAHNNLGDLLWQDGRPTDALAHFDQAVALRADSAGFALNRAVVRAACGLLEGALDDCTRAVTLSPSLTEAHFQRGHVLTRLHRMDEALAAFEQALARDPASSKGWNARGLVLAARGQFDAAVQSYDRAVHHDPGKVDAFVNRAAAFAALKQHNAALANYDRAWEADPTTPYLRGLRLRAKLLICAWRDVARDQEDLAAAITRGEKATPPWDSLALTGSPALQQQVARTWTADRVPADSSLGPPPTRARGKQIALGYFSADFHNHATAHLMAELFERHDRGHFRVVAFSFGPPRGDAMQQRIRAAFDEFIDVRGLSDPDTAALARAKGVDIAVDLKGYTGDARPGIFACRAAPVQVSYLGYPGTMGADYIDYIVADRILIPESDRRFYTEKVVTLPHSYQVNDSQRAIASRRFTRTDLGLPKTGFVFCCFNSAYKITPDIFAIWMRLLARVPGAVLWLLEDNPTAVVNLRKEAAAQGIDPMRLVFAPRLAPPEHLARHAAADLFLDTLPCCAHTTASDALWAGLPLLTCRGDALAGRVAASVLTALDLPDLIAASPAAYEEQALRLATAPTEMAAIKAKLMHQRTVSSLFDSARFARHIEAAYTRMIARHDAGLAPAHFDVAP